MGDRISGGRLHSDTKVCWVCFSEEGEQILITVVSLSMLLILDNSHTMYSALAA